MVSKSNPINFKKIAYIAISWVLISTFQVFYDYLVVLHFVETPTVYRFWQLVLANGTVALISGIITGLFLAKIDTWIRMVPFGQAIAGTALVYAFSSFFLIGLGSTFYQVITQQASPFSTAVQTEVQAFMGSVDFIKHLLSWGIILIGTIIVLAVNDKYGQGNFKDVLLGRYFQPREEERIFMFLDIKGSTTIAETLGAEKYFYFLKDFFNDATQPILQTKGEIYQYVGDEIVVSWKMKNGIEQANCLECFYAIQAAIIENDKNYLDKYNCLPEFKAGLHYGMAMAGELGRVKKEITFSGDVLNTASRIQMECNKRNVSIIVSDDLLSLLTLPEYMKTQAIGNIELRGKQKKVNMSTIKWNY